jgi:hypothetical protein
MFIVSLQNLIEKREVKMEIRLFGWLITWASSTSGGMTTRKEQEATLGKTVSTNCLLSMLYEDSIS